MKTLKEEFLQRAKEAGVEGVDPDSNMVKAYAHFDGPGCGDACEPFGATARGENAFLHGQSGYERYRIFGMLEQSFQWWIGKICLRLGLVSGPGAQAPGQKKRNKPQAASCKLQASGLTVTE